MPMGRTTAWPFERVLQTGGWHSAYRAGGGGMQQWSVVHASQWAAVGGYITAVGGRLPVVGVGRSINPVTLTSGLTPFLSITFDPSCATPQPSAMHLPAAAHPRVWGTSHKTPTRHEGCP